jgi:hypothetical protein
MSEYYEIKDLRHEKDGFEIRVGYFYEDIHPNELYCDETDTDEMAKRIDAGYDAWFGFWAKAYFNGHEMGHANLGGLYYKDDHAEGVIEKKQEYWYDDVIWEAVEEAKKQTGDLYKQLKLNFSFEDALPKERRTS